MPMIIISLVIKMNSKGPVLYWSNRVGCNNVIFRMPKFRTMKIDTPIVATHLLKNPSEYLTSVGSFLRETSLDELPQLWSVLKGDMSFVGPRPALFNQYDLIEIRTSKGIHKLKPGITGWAQINGRDDIDSVSKAHFDEHYLKKISLLFDFKIILTTVIRVLKREGITH